jgi:dihydroxyacetone kinase
MVATLGRASRLGERSRGSADPVATSFAVIVDALATAYLRGR